MGPTSSSWTGARRSAVVSRRPADVACSVHAIGSTYLGAFTWAALAAAGLLEVRTPGALDTLDAMFRTDVAPWPIYYF